MRSSIVLRTAVLALAAAFVPAASEAQVVVSITIAPPILPVYAQPLCPEDGFLWTPGYWAYGDEGYFWVPGVWLQPPSVGLLWTPGYWGWGSGLYAWNGGYWGAQVGFYGGVNYGFGYGGLGFEGGRWESGHFAYNTAVANINTTIIHNSYRTNVTVNNVHTSFNGGTGGLKATPTAAERTAMSAPHTAATPAQSAHIAAAGKDRSQLASVNHGTPASAAMSRPAAAASRPAVANKPAVAASRPAVANKPAAAASRPAVAESRPAAAESRPAAAASRPAAAASRPATPASHPAAAESRPAAASHPAPANKPAPAANHSAPAVKPAPAAVHPAANKPAPAARESKPVAEKK
jgi:hypothetical protein